MLLFIQVISSPVGNDDIGDAVGAIGVGILIILVGLYLIVMWIIENLVLVLMIAFVIGAIAYLIKKAPEWEEERKKKAEYISRNQGSYARVQSLHSRIGHNIDILSQAGIPVDDLKKSLKEYDKVVSTPPAKMYSVSKSQSNRTRYLNYSSAISGLEDLLSETTKLPDSLQRLREVTGRLSLAGVDVGDYRAVLADFPVPLSFSSSQEISIDAAWEVKPLDAEMVAEAKPLAQSPGT
jgi:hypothetical protein